MHHVLFSVPNQRIKCTTKKLTQRQSGKWRFLNKFDSTLTRMRQTWCRAGSLIAFAVLSIIGTCDWKLYRKLVLFWAGHNRDGVKNADIEMYISSSVVHTLNWARGVCYLVHGTLYSRIGPYIRPLFMNCSLNTNTFFYCYRDAARLGTDHMSSCKRVLQWNTMWLLCNVRSHGSDTGVSMYTAVTLNMCSYVT